MWISGIFNPKKITSKYFVSIGVWDDIWKLVCDKSWKSIMQWLYEYNCFKNAVGNLRKIYNTNLKHSFNI